ARRTLGTPAGTEGRSCAIAHRGVDERLCLAHERVQVCGALEALRVDLVDVLRPRRPGREPSAARRNLQAVDRRVVGWRSGQFGDDRLAADSLFLARLPLSLL